MAPERSFATSAALAIKHDSAQTFATTHTRADVLHIGYPKAASTFVVRFLEGHPQITVDQFQLSDLLKPIASTLAIHEKPCSNKVHISKDESVVDPGEAAARLHKVHPEAKVLLVIREQTDWLQSVYKFVMSQLPWNHRSFADYCTTPSGIVLLQAGHFDQTIHAYVDFFGGNRVRVLRFEDIVGAPKRFTAELCGFLGVTEQPLPQRRENETHAQIARIQRFFPVIEQL